MRTLENLTTLNDLKASGEALVFNKLLLFLNQFNEMLASSKDEYDYFSLIVAGKVFAEIVESQYRKDLLDSSLEEMEEYLQLLKESTTNMYKKFSEEHLS